MRVLIKRRLASPSKVSCGVEPADFCSALQVTTKDVKNIEVQRVTLIVEILARLILAF